MCASAFGVKVSPGSSLEFRTPPVGQPKGNDKLAVIGLHCLLVTVTGEQRERVPGFEAGVQRSIIRPSKRSVSSNCCRAHVKGMFRERIRAD